MHKFTPSTAEERKAYRVEVKAILSKMLDTEVTLTSSKLTYLSGRGITFNMTGMLSMHNGRYHVYTSNVDTVSFDVGDVESAVIYDDSVLGNTISLN
tara:strand:+ start:921 stop:1211 length:291 start_codon:yes stop_codon:yes gene_type:complete